MPTDKEIEAGVIAMFKAKDRVEARTASKREAMPGECPALDMLVALNRKDQALQQTEEKADGN